MIDTGSLRTIPRKSLHEELVDRLQTLIISGGLPPGSKVPEKDLCLKLGVSRTPLREALKVVASDGLVRLEPNRGAWVTQVTVSDVEEVFPILGALEALAGDLACQHITDAEIEAVTRLHAQMIASYEAQDLKLYFAINQQIHQAILTAARNETLRMSSQGLSLRMQRARYMANISQERWAEAVREHEAILHHLSARNGPELAQTLQSHLAAKQVSVVRWLQAQSQGG